MYKKEITIDTPLGKLCACVCNDEDYPAIFVYITREDGVEVDLVAAEVQTADGLVGAYLYGDTSTDSWTKRHIWRQEEISHPGEG